MNAKIKTNYQIEIGEYKLSLTKEQAMELLSILKEELNILTPAPIQYIPNIPKEFYKGDRFDPVDPFPDKNVIWCNQPYSTCSL